MSNTDAKICIIVLVLTTIVGDTLAEKFGWCSISQMVRNIDVASGYWLRWVLVGMILHWFAPPPFGGWGMNQIATLGH